MTKKLKVSLVESGEALGNDIAELRFSLEAWLLELDGEDEFKVPGVQFEVSVMLSEVMEFSGLADEYGVFRMSGLEISVGSTVNDFVEVNVEALHDGNIYSRGELFNIREARRRFLASKRRERKGEYASAFDKAGLKRRLLALEQQMDDLTRTRYLPDDYVSPFAIMAEHEDHPIIPRLMAKAVSTEHHAYRAVEFFEQYIEAFWAKDLLFSAARVVPGYAIGSFQNYSGEIWAEELVYVLAEEFPEDFFANIEYIEYIPFAGTAARIAAAACPAAAVKNYEKYRLQESWALGVLANAERMLERNEALEREKKEAKKKKKEILALEPRGFPSEDFLRLLMVSTPEGLLGEDEEVYGALFEAFERNATGVASNVFENFLRKERAGIEFSWIPDFLIKVTELASPQFVGRHIDVYASCPEAHDAYYKIWPQVRALNDRWTYSKVCKFVEEHCAEGGTSELCHKILEDVRREKEADLERKKENDRGLKREFMTFARRGFPFSKRIMRLLMVATPEGLLGEDEEVYGVLFEVLEAEPQRVAKFFFKRHAELEFSWVSDFLVKIAELAPPLLVIMNAAAYAPYPETYAAYCEVVKENEGMYSFVRKHAKRHFPKLHAKVMELGPRSLSVADVAGYERDIASGRLKAEGLRVAVESKLPSDAYRFQVLKVLAAKDSAWAFDFVLSEDEKWINEMLRIDIVLVIARSNPRLILDRFERIDERHWAGGVLSHIVDTTSVLQIKKRARKMRWERFKGRVAGWFS